MPTSPSPERVTRRLTVDDFHDSIRLGIEAFGQFPEGMPAPTPDQFPRPGRHTWGTFEDGTLVARVVGNEFHSWFRGAEVPTCGVGGVTVVAERRGNGLLRELFAAMLDEATGRGEVISTLFPTAPGIYRRLGYEIVGSYDTVSVPTALLATVAEPAGVTVRRARLEDLPAVRATYDAWAAVQGGPLTRRGAAFPATDEELLAAFTGHHPGRGRRRPAGRLRHVEPRPRLRQLGHHRGRGPRGALPRRGPGAVAGAGVLRLGDGFGAGAHLRQRRDPAGAAVRLVGGGRATPVHAAGARRHRRPVAAAPDRARQRRLPGRGRRARLDGRRLPAAGCGRPDQLRAGRGGAPGATVLSPQGLALLYAGDQSCGNLRLAGYLRCGSPADDGVLDALLGSGQPHIRDYF